MGQKHADDDGDDEGIDDGDGDGDDDDHDDDDDGEDDDDVLNLISFSVNLVEVFHQERMRIIGSSAEKMKNKTTNK